MCLLCVEWNKGSMTAQETLKALGEMVEFETDEEKQAHLFELAEKVIDKDSPIISWEDDSIFGSMDELDDTFSDEDL
jgi:hypothetical protein